jgi:hypothetical protein
MQSLAKVRRNDLIAARRDRVAKVSGVFNVEHLRNGYSSEETPIEL